MKTAASRLQLLAGVLTLVLIYIPSVGLAQEKAINTPFYQDDNLFIAPYSHGPVASWCKQDRNRRFGDYNPRPYVLNVRYSVDHEQRDALFAPDYEEFVLQRIVPAIKNACQGTVDIPENFHIYLEMSNQKDEGGSWDVIRDILRFRYRDNTVVQTGYAPGPEITKGKSVEEIEALKRRVPKVLERSDTVLTKIGPFTIYAHDYQLCMKGGAEVDAVFDIPGEKRDGWIEAKYGNTASGEFDLFVAEGIVPVLREKCAQQRRIPQLNVFFYEENETEMWDMMTFDVLPSGYTLSPGVSTMKAHRMGPRAERLAILERNRQLLGACTGGPFCDEMGGIFLDAIYRNDIETVRLIDLKLNMEYRNTSSHRQARQLHEILSNQNAAGADPTLLDLNFLVHLSGKYMYDYSRFATSKEVLTGDRTSPCFRNGATTVDTRATTDVIHYEDQYGIPQGSVGGIQVGQKYRINPEFIELCDKICGSASGEMGDFLADMFNLKKSEFILSGLEQVIQTRGCESPEIRQFERNLVAMTTHFLEGDPGRAYNITPDEQRALDEDKRAKAREEHAGAEERQEAWTKEQAMNSEIMRVNGAIDDAISANDDAYWARIRQGGLSGKEIAELNRQRQAFRESKYQELRNAISEIRIRYQ